MNEEIEKIIYTKEEILERVKELAAEVSQNYKSDDI